MKTFAPAAALCLALVALPARAGVYTDDLTRCLVAKTTDADKTTLVKWIFSAIALHKELVNVVTIPARQRDEINRETGALYTRLLTVDCRAQTVQGFKYEGEAAITGAFQVLGQVAAQGVFASPEVTAGMDELGRNVDAKAIQATLDEAKK